MTGIFLLLNYYGSVATILFILQLFHCKQEMIAIFQLGKACLASALPQPFADDKFNVTQDIKSVFHTRTLWKTLRTEKY